jgi:hypothetical protein
VARISWIDSRWSGGAGSREAAASRSQRPGTAERIRPFHQSSSGNRRRHAPEEQAERQREAYPQVRVAPFESRRTDGGTAGITQRGLSGPGRKFGRIGRGGVMSPLANPPGDGEADSPDSKGALPSAPQELALRVGRVFARDLAIGLDGVRPGVTTPTGSLGLIRARSPTGAHTGWHRGRTPDRR